MSYDIAFSAVSGSDWTVAIELIDPNTNGALADAANASFDLQVLDRSGSALLRASTADDTIEKPETNQVRWHFTDAQLSALCPGTTYKVSLRMTTEGGTIPLVLGSLAYIDGGFH